MSLPPSGVAGTTETLRIDFSEPLRPGSVDAWSAVVVPHQLGASCTTSLSCAGRAVCHAGRCQRDPISSSWLADFANPPLSQSRQDDLALTTVSLDTNGQRISVQPLVPLAPRRLHTLLVGPTLSDVAGNPVWREPDHRVALRLRFSTGDGSGARPTVWLASPAAKTADLPTNLHRVVVRFSAPVYGVSAATLGLRLETGIDVRVQFGASSELCAGAPAGSCHVLWLQEPLPPCSTVTLWTGELRDGLGRQVLPPVEQVIATGEGGDGTAPLVGAQRLVGSDGCLVLRLVTDEPADVTVHGSWAGAAGTTVGQRMHELPLPAPGGPAQLNVSVQDLAGNRLQLSPAIDWAAAPRVVISEVLANPLGQEPAQELVELCNLSAQPVNLEGWTLDDNDDGSGVSVLPAAVLAPGAYAVVVGKGYQPLSGEDAVPRPDAQLVRLGGVLGGSGLANSGESMALRDPRGVLASSYSNQLGSVAADSVEGKGVERVDLHGCDVAQNWALSAGLATPGGPPAPATGH